MESNSMRKIENFNRIVTNLKEALKDHYPPVTSFELTGIVAHFELCYETAWKTARAHLLESGVSKELLNTPRNVFKSAYKHVLIYDEDL